MADDGQSATWRKAAYDRWADAQDHVGQADTNPKPYVHAAADAAVRVVLERLIDKAKTDGDAGAVEAMYALEAELGEPAMADSRDGQSGASKGWQLKGHCPMGCGETLFVGTGGYVTCSWHQCPNPDALAALLADPLISEHVVRFGEDGFDVQHPLSERGQDLVACELHQHIRSLDGPPVRPGRYVARQQDGRWTWRPL